jgi:hypothetical protein
MRGRHQHHLRACVVIGCCCAGLAAPSDARAGDGVPRGALRAIGAPHECVSAAALRDCVRGRGVTSELYGVRMTPDGRHLHAFSGGAGEKDLGFAVFARSLGTGRLKQLRGDAGCWRVRAEASCAAVPANLIPTDLAFSGDGRHTYGVSADRVVVLARNRRTDALRPLAARKGCISSADASCTAAWMFEPRDVVISPDDRMVLVISSWHVAPNDPRDADADVSGCTGSPAVQDGSFGPRGAAAFSPGGSSLHAFAGDRCRPSGPTRGPGFGR